MSAGEMLDVLAGRGFTFEVRGDRLHVDPTPDAATVDELRAAKAVLLSYIGEHGGRWPIPLASEHRYVIWRGALDDRHLSVCLSCGTPPLLHGPGALDDPLILDDPDDAPLIRAQAVVAARFIVVAEVATHIGDVSAGGKLCSRCHRIGRVDRRNVCTFCLAVEDRE